MKLKMSTLTKKRLLTGSIAFVAVFAVYQYTETTVQKRLNPTKAYYTAEDIPPHTQIKEEMIWERIVPAESLPPNAVLNKKDIVGRWTAEGYGLPKNSLIYKGKILKTNDMPDSAVLKLKPDESAFPLLVDLETSSGNAIIPDSYVDLYFVTDKTENRKPLSGLLFERIRVTSVKDSQTRNVFDSEDYTERDGNNSNNQNVASSSSNPNAVAKLYTLAVSKKQLQLLNQAKILGNIVPVANGMSYEKETGDESFEKMSDSALLTWIMSNSYNSSNVPMNETGESTEEVTDDSASVIKENSDSKSSTADTGSGTSQEFAGPVLTTKKEETE